MSTFLHGFEAIGSRIASCSSPRGTPGRLQALRVRRCFSNRHRGQSAALGTQRPLQHELRSQENLNEVGQASSRLTAGLSWGDIAVKPEEGQSELDVQRRITEIYGDIPQPLSDDAIAGFDQFQWNTRLYSALRARDPHAVLNALSYHVRQNGLNGTKSLLATLPPTTFSEILSSLDPVHFVGRYLEMLRERRPTRSPPGLPSVADENGYYKFCGIFLSQVKYILEERWKSFRVPLSDYKYLLRCARATGRVKDAEAIWTALVTKSKGNRDLAPDTECYNHFLSVKVWHDTINPYERYRLRVIPDNLTPRTWDKPPYPLKGHKIGTRGGLAYEVEMLIKRMSNTGLLGNEETFSLMLISFSREGNLGNIASLLYRVWEIDVDAVMDSEESEVPSPKLYNSSSPYYPSSRLLFALAHAYGTNNQISVALRLIDYVSRQYRIPIPLDVWDELLQWTFILSTRPKVLKRRGQTVETGKEIGQLPPEGVANLWNTMVSEPYNVQPTFQMYDRYIKNLFQRQRFGDAQILMEEARRLFEKDVLELRQLSHVFKLTNTQNSLRDIQQKRARDLVYSELRVRRNKLYIKRWVKHLIHHGSKSLRVNETWAAHNIPKIIQTWNTFLPHTVRYRIRSGALSFKID